MKLSTLQKFILNLSYGSKKTSRQVFNKFYNSQNNAPKGEDKVKIITKSLERLIDKGLMVGFGERTKYKWYIKEVRLTASGRRLAKKMMGEQAKLPFKIQKAKAKIQK
jgi:hypothetical protein